jgi:hypothetical protein
MQNCNNCLFGLPYKELSREIQAEFGSMKNCLMCVGIPWRNEAHQQLIIAPGKAIKCSKYVKYGD